MTERSNITAMAPLIPAEVFEIEAAPVTPYNLTEETIATTRTVLLKVTDAYGVEGWGEASRAGLGMQVDESHVRRLTAASFRLGARL